MNKDRVAEALITWHFQVEPDLLRVYRVLTPNEDEPAEPIKLIEVNAATLATAHLETFRFAPTADIPYPTLIAEITPASLENLHRSGGLPEGWSLEHATLYLRPAA